MEKAKVIKRYQNRKLYDTDASCYVTLDEIAERFGQESELRRVEMKSLRWLVDLARRAGVLRIVVNGSFVADVWEPNDVDCALLIGPDYPRDPAADAELQQGLPFIHADLPLCARWAALSTGC